MTRYTKAKLLHIFTRSYMRLYIPFHRIRKKILFSSFDGRYSGNPRAISEKMHRLYPDYEQVWFLEKDFAGPGMAPDYVRQVVKRRKHSLELYRELATSFCYVTSGANHNNIVKRKGQFFIQTYHGDTGMKKILYDTRKKGKQYSIVTDGKYTDLCVSGSWVSEMKFRSAFAYRGEILKVGMPRNDKLILPRPEEEAATRQKLGIPEGAKVLIFAPTFRNGQEKQDVLVDLQQVMDILLSRGENWVCLVRGHKNVAKLLFDCDGERFIDASRIPDMADLLAIADMLITDYSSSSGDLIRRGKAVILALFDLEVYQANERQLYYDPALAGYFCAYDQEELNALLRTKTEEDYRQNSQRLCEFFQVVETGHASEEICRRIDGRYRAYLQRKERDDRHEKTI